MGRFLSHVGSFCVRFRWPVVIVWLLLAFGLTMVTTRAPSTANNDISLPGTGSQAATDLLTTEFPPQENGSSPAVYKVESGKIDDNGPNQEAITDAYKALKKEPAVSSVTNPFSQPQAGFVSSDHKYAFMPILLKTPNNNLTVKEAQKYYDIAVQPAQAQGMKAAVGGPIGNTLFVTDTATSEQLGMAAAAIILLIAFGSLIAVGMPLISAVIGLFLGLSLIWFLGIALDIPSVGATLARMIGLGVGIDYALFMVYRHRRNIMEKGLDPYKAAIHATATAGGAIIFAGGTVIIALVSLQVAGIPFISGLGYACAAAVFTAVMAAITFLPALLGIVGGGITRLKIPLVGRSTKHPIGNRWARIMTAHPIVTAIIAVGLLIPLIIPVTTLVLGQEDDAVSPKSTSQRQAFDLMSQGFGPGYNGPLVVAMSMDPVAAPSNSYDKQYTQATQMQTELEQENIYLTQQQQELEQQQAVLEEQSTELQAEATSLEAEQATLESEATTLESKQAALEKEAARLKSQAEQLIAAAEKLVRKEFRFIKDLGKGRVAIKVLERRIAKARLPFVKAALEERLADRRKQQKKLRKKLKTNTEQLRVLRDEGEKLEAQAADLIKQGEELAKQAAQLAIEGEQLEAEGQDLQAQEASLEAQATSLQEWGDELQQQADEAQQQQKQAEQLQKQITQELTTAGGDARGTDPRIVKMQKALAKPGNVQTVAPPEINKSGNAVIMSVIAKSQPAAPQTADLVGHLRNKTIPSATVPGEDVYVGGSTAGNVDLATLITEKLLLVIATIVLLSSILLMIAFRSLLIPLQAAICNILAAAASFGIVTVVFQWGWGLDAIGLATSSGSVPVISYVPLMMFAALFGLSMDYQVFVMSTIQGENAAGAEAHQAVRDGVATAGKVVVTAALIMMSVFGSFVLNDSSVIKQFGVGLTVAVALAATLVLTLAPALLTLFGKWTWKLPKFLDKILPDLDLEGRALEAKWDAEAEAQEAGANTGGGITAPPSVKGADILPGGNDLPA